MKLSLVMFGIKRKAIRAKLTSKEIAGSIAKQVQALLDKKPMTVDDVRWLADNAVATDRDRFCIAKPEEAKKQFPNIRVSYTAPNNIKKAVSVLEECDAVAKRIAEAPTAEPKKAPKAKKTSTKTTAAPAQAAASPVFPKPAPKPVSLTKPQEAGLRAVISGQTQGIDPRVINGLVKKGLLDSNSQPTKVALTQFSK